MRTVFILFCCIIFLGTPAAGLEPPLLIVVGKDAYVSDGPQCNLGRYPLNADIFEPLVRFDPKLRLKPALAVRWQYMGNRRWRFWLRENVRFHDGTPFDGAAARAFFLRMQQNGNGLLDLESVQVHSSHAIDLTTKKENLILPFVLSHPYLGVGRDGNPPVGTGAFKFAEYLSGQYLAVQRNGDYWGTPAKEERVKFKFRSDRNGRMLDILSGGADVVTDFPWEALPELKTRRDYLLHATPRGTYVGLMVNLHGVLKEPAVRKALQVGLDRGAINQVIWNGLGDAGAAFIDRTFLHPHDKQLSSLPFDAQKARRLLAGRKLSLTLVAGFPNADVHGPLPELLADQFRQLGITAKIVSISDMGLYHRKMKSGEGDLWLEKGNLNSADITFLPRLLFHPDGYYAGQLSMPAGSETFCAALDAATGAKNGDDIRLHTIEALNEIIAAQALFIPIVTLPNLVAAKINVVLPPLHPTLLAVRWAEIERKR